MNGYREYSTVSDYKKIKVGPKVLDDAQLDLGSFVPDKATRNHPFASKKEIMKALIDKDIPTLRAISNFYYQTSGIYERVCNYFAFLYRYDWYVVPEIYDDKVKEEKVLTDFSKVLNYLDNSYLKKILGDIALKVLKDGCYYGYIFPSNEGMFIQDLPVEYCRSRYSIAGQPTVEFNMKYFDTFKDPAYRMKVLNLFPDDFKKGYILYQKRKLEPEYRGDQAGWYLLDPANSVKFNFNGSDVPQFVTAIPAIIDLDAAQDLDRRKQMQKLLKILIQKLPMDKNGDLIFDIDEARDIHNNAVQMLKRAVGVDILTTFADVESIDLSDKNTTTTTDDLAKVERTVFNAFGTSQNLFNTDGNLSLEKSILNDESSVRNLLLQFSMFLDRHIQSRNTNRKKYNFKLYLLETTQYNYKELSKLYKEQTQIGYSKMLPQIALGHSQSFILNSITFENDFLHLSEIMIPPLSSNTINGEDVLGKKDQSNTNKTGNKTEAPSDNKGGRPEKEDSQKSEKTIKNKESMS